MATLYVSNLGAGSHSGLDTTNPKSFTEYKALTLTSATAEVSFKRGDVYRGSLNARAGSVGSPLLFTAWGTGNKPKISGMYAFGTTGTTWTLESGNIYWADTSD